jgi:hypothetical protein
MDTKQFDKIQSITGWFSTPEMNVLYPFVVALPKNSLLVEIGTFHGKSTLFWRFTNPDIKILTIDICNQKGFGSEAVNITEGIVIPKHIDQEVLDEGNIFQVRGSSHEVVKTFNWDIDFLFIDSLHTYEDTRDNIIEWGSHVKPDHFIVFHDYSSGFPGVIKAVNEYLADNKEAKLISNINGVAVIKI